jgi:pilus assembly protein CpaB
MQKSKMILLLMVALLMAFGASFIANKLVSKQLNDDSASATNTNNIVVAATDINYGQTLQAENLTIKPRPIQSDTTVVFTRIEDVIGKIAKGEIYQGETIIEKRLASSNEGTILASLVNENMRAVSVRVDDVIGVAGFLLPNNRVDVLASRMDQRRSITRTILQNIKVLAVDQTSEASKDKPLLVRAVTLEVSPEDSEALFQAIQEGSIHLTLRNPKDSSDTALSKAKEVVAPAPTPTIKPKKKYVKKKKTKAKKKLAKQRTKQPTRAKKSYAPATKPIAQVPKPLETYIPTPVQSYTPARVPMPIQIPSPVMPIRVVKTAKPIPVEPTKVAVAKPEPPKTTTVTVIRGMSQSQMVMKIEEAQ